jgi:Cu-Zn family superoxide dismutase
MKTRLSRTKTLAVAIPLVGLCFAGCWDDDDDDDVLGGDGDGTPSQAEASVRGYADSGITGTVQFTEEGDSLVVSGSIIGLVPGQAYGIHVHMVGDCSAPDSSGPHFHADETHGNPFGDVKHRGDLPNVQTDANGVGHLSFATDDLSLDPGDRSIIGRSVVMHALPDDYVSQPAGNSGERIACGVILALDGEGGSLDTTGTGGVDTTGTDGGGTGLPPYP